MFFLKKIITRYLQEKQAINAECSQLIRDIDEATKELDDIFKVSQAYIKVTEINEWQQRHAWLTAEVDKIDSRKLKRASKYGLLQDKIHLLEQFPQHLKQRILAHNEAVLELRIEDVDNLIGEVEGRKLDHQQLKCIAEDAENQLVIAGAGTGKTTTILGKIKHLLASGECKPEAILALSFTNASAAEMLERVATETGARLDVMTFHKLGLSIISEVENVVPKITKLNLHTFIRGQIQERILEPKYLRTLNRYCVYGHGDSKTEFDFGSQHEYEEYIKINPPTTLNGEKVKSYGEMDIANFLFENGIKYLYEPSYKIDTRDEKYGQYYPDFYLPEYDIYIEYFGVNRSLEVPEYFTDAHGMSAQEAYRESMRWKKELHKQNHTKLIECFSYEKAEDVLLKNLKDKLSDLNIKFSPMSPQELWDKVSQNNKNNLDGIISLFETIINLVKSNQYSMEYLYQKNLTSAEKTLLSLVEPIFKEYDKYLSEHNEIDFNDMINLAANYI